MGLHEKIWEIIKRDKVVKYDDLATEVKNKKAHISRYINALNKAKVVSCTHHNTLGRPYDTITLIKDKIIGAPVFNRGVLRYLGGEITVSKDTKIKKTEVQAKLLRGTLKTIIDNNSDEFRVGDLFESSNLVNRWLKLLAHNKILAETGTYRNSKIFAVNQVGAKEAYKKLLKVRNWRAVLEEIKKD